MLKHIASSEVFYFIIFNPDISRVRGVHFQDIQGRSRSRLLQALDNAANGRLGLARRVKIFEKLNKKIFGTNCHLTTRSKIANNKLFSLLIKRPLENFHEIFGLKLLKSIQERDRNGSGWFDRTSEKGC